MTIKTNFDEFNRCVNGVTDTVLPEVLSPQIQRSIFSSANKIVRPELRGNTPVLTGRTRRSVRGLVKEARKRRVRIHRVGQKSAILRRLYGLVGYARPAGNLANILEGGSVERRHRNGKSVGAIRGVGMLTRALFTTGGRVQQAMVDGLNTGIDKAVQKGNAFVRHCRLGRLR